VAAVMECSPAKISRQEKGTHAISISELSHLVTQLYCADSDEARASAASALAEMEALRQRAADRQGWWREFEGDIPLHMRTYVELEDDASKIITFSGDIIPGLLQDPEYIRLQARKFGTKPPNEVEQIIWLRTKRQERLGHLEFDAIVAEGAVRRCIGDGHFGQLATLLERSVIPGVSLRILPNSTGVHGVASHYVVMTIPGGELDPVMYLEYCGGSFLVEEERAVRRTVEQHDKLPAMNQEDSRDFLKRLLAQNRTGNIGVA